VDLLEVTLKGRRDAPPMSVGHCTSRDCVHARVCVCARAGGWRARMCVCACACARVGGCRACARMRVRVWVCVGG
jgi:hypothetical protein